MHSHTHTHTHRHTVPWLGLGLAHDDIWYHLPGLSSGVIEWRGCLAEYLLADRPPSSGRVLTLRPSTRFRGTACGGEVKEQNMRKIAEGTGSGHTSAHGSWLYEFCYWGLYVWIHTQTFLLMVLCCDMFIKCMLRDIYVCNMLFPFYQHLMY